MTRLRLNAPPEIPELGSRALFPTLRARAYLNHAAVSPPSTAVRRSINFLLNTYGSEGLGALPVQLEMRDQLKGRLGRLLGVSPGDLGLVRSTTSGVRQVAFGLRWAAGDRVLVFDGEFPANVTPWIQAARHFSLELRSLPTSVLEDDEGLHRVERELERGLRLVAVSAVQFSTGLAAPLGRLGAMCKHHGALLFVDGIQAAGVMPLHPEQDGVDFLSCGGHKWLMGLEGAGFLWIRPGRVHDLEPRLAGWLSHEDPVDFLTRDGGLLRTDKPIRSAADFVEDSALNALGYAALNESVRLLLELGVPAIFEHVSGYLDRLEGELTAAGFESLRPSDPTRRSGILSLRPPEGGSVVAAAEHLNREGIAVSTPNGLLRFAPHWPNSPDEIPEIVRVSHGIPRG